MAKEVYEILGQPVSKEQYEEASKKMDAPQSKVEEDMDDFAKRAKERAAYDSDYEFTKSELYGTPLSKGAISAGVKKVKDMPFRERLKAGNEKLDREATQAAREAGAEERREMKKGGIVKSSASKRADGVAIKGKTKGRMV
jgi:hypothetical protein